MRTDLNLTRLAALLAMSAFLAAGLGCNESDDPAQAENLVLVTQISVAGNSVSSGTDTTASVAYTLRPRNPGNLATSFWHDLTLTSYTVSFEPAVVTPMSGPISTGFCPAGGSCTVDVTLVPSALKPPVNTVTVAHIAFEGRDTQDNPVNFTADAALTFIP